MPFLNLYKSNFPPLHAIDKILLFFTIVDSCEKIDNWNKMNLQLFSEGGRKDRLRWTADDESAKIEPLSGLHGCEGRGQKEMLCYEKV